MENLNFFNKKIELCAKYYEEWFYRGNSNIEFDGKPIKRTLYFNLHNVFSNYFKSQIGNENVIPHNCLGCNFEEGARNINLFFRHNINSNSKIYFLTTYTILFYLQAERIAVIYKELGYVNSKNEFNWESFPELLKIKRWANFFKHPKSYMLLHHPMFFIEGDPDIPNCMISGKIDNCFINKFYKSENNNIELRTILENKDKYIVIFPDILNFTKNLCLEFENIVELIKNNKEIVAKLSSYTTTKSILSD